MNGLQNSGDFHFYYVMSLVSYTKQKRAKQEMFRKIEFQYNLISREVTHRNSPTDLQQGIRRSIAKRPHTNNGVPPVQTKTNSTAGKHITLASPVSGKSL